MKARFVPALSLALAALGLGGCIDINFDPPTLVDSPRILGMRAEPPEVPFGSDVLFEALVVDANGDAMPGQDGVELRWTVCLSLEEIVSAAGLGFGSGLADTCANGGEDLVVLENVSPTEARLRGETFLGLVMSLMNGGGTGGDTPPVDPQLLATLLTVVNEVGVPLRVQLSVMVDGEVILTGHKRFAVAMRDDLTTNPPPPRFAVDGVFYSARDDVSSDPTVCVAETSPPPSAVDTDVALAPDENEDWLESYPVVDLAGDVIINDEAGYYSWFSTVGALRDAVTQAPNANTVWHTPEEPGTYPLIVVVRDGHLGSSWCRTEITVAP